MAMPKLTALRVRHATEPGRYGDGDGLYLRVRENGSRAWLLRCTPPGGKTYDLGLGSVADVTLAEARPPPPRRKVRAGVDPTTRSWMRQSSRACTSASRSFKSCQTSCVCRASNRGNATDGPDRLLSWNVRPSRRCNVQVSPSGVTSCPATICELTWQHCAARIESRTSVLARYAAGGSRPALISEDN